MGSYLVAVIVVRSILSRRSRGTRFVVLRVGHWQPAEWLAALLAASSIVFMVGGTVLAALGHPGPMVSAEWPVWIAGTALMAGGTGLMAWSQISMGASWRVGLDREQSTVLVRKGPFGWMRNPIYSSMVAVFAGVTLLVPSALVAGGWVILVSFVEWQVRVVEEPFLIHAHGGEYFGWAQKVGRFLPRIGLIR